METKGTPPHCPQGEGTEGRGIHEKVPVNVRYRVFSGFRGRGPKE